MLASFIKVTALCNVFDCFRLNTGEMDEGDSGFLKFRQTSSDDVVSLASSTADSIFLEGTDVLCFSGFPAVLNR